ncbi:MAG: glycosyl transferase [Candidatus Cloacimonetes bacterium HGW-Cloacimonetes-3]|jgi:glycosyltransferase involved in cell wall biosynthesis|nr:MAG: glycosyl transferase [Candidatus Cloacimonetes bacterium HGW-Cloacimonetes-3]
MTISLIIPVYNRLALLEKCLLAISKQVLCPDEIILSDDGSTEDIKGFYAKQKQASSIPMKLVRQEHTVFRAARVRNNGVSVSRGDLLVFIDQDIIIPPLYIQTIADNMLTGRFLSGYPVRLSAAQSEAIDHEVIENCNFITKLLPAQQAKIRSQFRKDYLHYLLCRYAKIGVHGAKLRSGVAAINKVDYVKVNGYDENYEGCGGEDDDLGRRLLAIGKTGYNFVRTHIPLHLYHKPNYQSLQGDMHSYFSKRKKEVTRHNYRCEKGFDAPRDDIEVFGE